MQINDFIYDLLLDHNCVIIPKVGAFVGNYKSAQINNLNHKIYPPSKKITFNKSLNQNDGLLIDYVATKNNIKYEKAEQNVLRWAKNINELLAQQELIDFPKVGRLFNDSIGKTRFEQYSHHNLLKDAFGLQEVIAFPLKKEKQTPAEKPAAKVIPIASQSKPQRTINYKLITTAAAIALLLIYSWYLGFQTNLFKGGNFHYSELNPFSSKVCEIYKPRLAKPYPVTSLDFEALSVPKEKRYIPFSLFFENETKTAKTKIVDLKSEEFAKPDSTKVALTLPKNISSGMYQIVVGCFKESENATKFIDKLRKKGYKNSGLIDIWNGLHRVRIDAYTNKQDALDALGAVKAKENAGAWIVKK